MATTVNDSLDKVDQWLDVAAVGLHVVGDTLVFILIACAMVVAAPFVLLFALPFYGIGFVARILGWSRRFDMTELRWTWTRNKL